MAQHQQTTTQWLKPSLIVWKDLTKTFTFFFFTDVDQSMILTFTPTGRGCEGRYFKFWMEKIMKSLPNQWLKYMAAAEAQRHHNNTVVVEPILQWWYLLCGVSLTGLDHEDTGQTLSQAEILVSSIHIYGAFKQRGGYMSGDRGLNTSSMSMCFRFKVAMLYLR